MVLNAKYSPPHLRTVAQHTSKFPKGFDERLKSDLAYNLMFCDVIRWLGTRTDLSGIAFDMCVKYSIISLASIMEAVLEQVVPAKTNKRIDGQGIGVTRTRILTLQQRGVIDDKLKEKLNNLWDLRNYIHIPGCDKNVVSEYYKNYGRKEYNEGRAAVFGLLESLK